jgi:hypothetical protein
MLILRRSNYIVTASGIVTLRKRLFSAPVVSALGLHYDARSEKHQIIKETSRRVRPKRVNRWQNCMLAR